MNGPALLRSERFTGWLLALYPATWRVRYEDEFRDVLEQAQPLSLSAIADIVNGALDARLNYGRTARRLLAARRARSRRAALAALLLIGLAPLAVSGSGNRSGFHPPQALFP